MKPLPHPGLVLLLEAPPAGHPRAAAHLLGEYLPGNSRLEDEQNARKSCAIAHARAPALGFRSLRRQEWFDNSPKFVGYEWFRHGRRILDHGVLLGALNGCENETMVFATGSPTDLTRLFGGCFVP